LGGFVVGAVLVLVVGLRAFRGDLAWRPEVFAQRQRWTETADIALTQLVVSVLIGADVVLVGLLGSSSATEAGFQALSTLTKAPVYIAAGTVLVTFPLLRSAGVQVDVVLRSALRSFAHLVLLAAAVLATLPLDLALLVLPASYAPATALLPWLAAAGFGYATMTVLATVLLAMRAQRRSQVGLVLAVVLVLSGLVLGWQLRELVGLAVGGALGALAASVALAVLAAPLLPRGTARLALYGLASTGVLVAALQLVRFSPLLWLGAVGLAGAAALHSMRGGTTLFARRTDRATT
jgi:O-antigen/teichoic acid export membrane protein